MADSRRVSAFNQASLSTDHERDGRPKSREGLKNDMWSSMLDNVASGKRLPEKHILVLGGTPESQKDFLDSVSNDSPAARKQLDRQSNKPPPIANQFALGYTFRDVLDADHEDILARLSVHLLSDPIPSFAPLLRPLFTQQTLSNMLTVILLDWAQPWSWLRQLRDWIRLLRSVLLSLDSPLIRHLEELAGVLRDRGRPGAFDGGGGAVTDGGVKVPLGPGELDEALGIPLCVVCQNADKIEMLEKERAWKEEEFDFVLQFVRTVLLKHGASLIYTTPSVPSSLQTLIHSSLGIQSLLKRQPLKHNVIDRDKVLVPCNWDSWGKIRVLREGFDVEGISDAWSIDLQNPIPAHTSGVQETNGTSSPKENPALTEEHGAVKVYEETIRDIRNDNALSSANASGQQNGQTIEVECLYTQDFLVGQLEVLERLRAEDEQALAGKGGRRDAPAARSMEYRAGDGDERVPDTGIRGPEGNGRLNEHIGPVQFNVGGIQVDADDMLKRLKDREANRAEERETPVLASDGKPTNDALASFFAGLMKKKGGQASNNPRSSPQL